MSSQEDQPAPGLVSTPAPDHSSPYKPPTLNDDSLVYHQGQNIPDLVEEWLNRHALRTLVEMFGGRWPTGTLVEIVDQLVTFSDTWNYRRSGTRLDIVDEQLNDADDILSAAAQLGLVQQPPLTSNQYDWIFVLGGLVTGNIARVSAIANLLRSGVQTPGVALLGSFRELHEKELELAAETTSSKAQTEVDVLQALADTMLPSNRAWKRTTSGDPLSDPRRAAQHGHRDQDSVWPATHVFAASSGDPENRNANTGDTYQQAARTLALHRGQRILLVTSRIYRYQWLDAIRLLGAPLSLSIEAFGTEAAATRFGPAWYLQEIRSMLISSKALLAITGAGA